MYIGMFMAGFLTLLLSAKKDKKSHDFLLMAWLLLSASNLLFFYHDFNYPTRYLWLELAGALMPFLLAPLLYFYVCALVLPRKFVFWRYAYHLVPFLFMYSSSLLYGAEANLVTEDGFIQMSGSAPFQLRYYGLILAASSFLYPTLSLYLLFRHRNRIANQFSYLEKINMSWLRNWIILSMVAFWFCFAIIWAGSFQWIDFLTSFQFVAFSVVVNIAVIGFFGVKQTTIFTNPPISIPSGETAPPERYATNKLGTEESKKLAGRLEKYMLEEKPYLDGQLSLESLANQTGMTRHDLSQLINDQLGTNFFGYVNKYRVEAFKQMLKDPKYEHYTLLGIALETGFSSKSSFNNIFKKLEGVTPSEFKRSLQRS